MDFKENNSCVYFFVDNNGTIRINKMNNNEDDIRSLYFTRYDASVILFAYDYYKGVLHVTNLKNDSLKELLEIRMSGSKPSDPFLKQTLDQLDSCCDFLTKTYQWKGEIVSGYPTHDEVVKLSIKDYNLAWGFLTSSLWNLNFEVMNLDVYVVSELQMVSEFVNEGEKYSTKLGIIEGPAILLRRNNSSFLNSQNIIYQYYTNLADLYNFDTGDHNAYIDGMAHYLEDTLGKYLNNNSIGERSDWFMFIRGGQVFIERNDKHMTSDSISNKFGSYKVVITFGYVRTKDSGYIIISDVSRKSMASGNYHEMYNFLMDNLDSIGHVDSDGKVLDKEPMVLFDDFTNDCEWVYISETPVWVYIKTVLSKCYNFKQMNIPVLKCNFRKNFDAKLVEELNDTNSDIVGKYVEDKDDVFPFIVWNESFGKKESYLGSFHSLINEYLKFVSRYGDLEVDSFSSNKPNDMIAHLKNLKDNILSDSQSLLMFENEMLLGVEFSKYYHEYNSFMLMFDVLSFDRKRIEEAMASGDDKQSDIIASLADDVHQKMYYVLLKMIGVLSAIKYGESIEDHDANISVGDFVIRKGLQGNVMRVEEIHIIGDNSRAYKCLDLVSDITDSHDYDDISLFNLVFEDYDQYNKNIRVASRDNDIDGYYRRLLTKWLRNPHVKEIEEGEFVEIESAQPFEELLREQNEFFDHSTDSLLTEVLLNETRKARS
jgi:hypothetical protein